MAKSIAATQVRAPGPSDHPSAPPKSAKHVIVASKLPTALELQICVPVTKRVAGQHGYVEETTFHKTGPVVMIRGTARPVGQAPKRFPKAPEMTGEIPEGGCALTFKVDADWWAEWLAQNKDTDLVRNRIVFAYADRDYVEDFAEEHGKERSGLDPLEMDDPEKPDRRIPRPIDGSVSSIEKAEVG